MKNSPTLLRRGKKIAPKVQQAKERKVTECVSGLMIGIR